MLGGLYGARDQAGFFGMPCMFLNPYIMNLVHKDFVFMKERQNQLYIINRTPGFNTEGNLI